MIGPYGEAHEEAMDVIAAYAATPEGRETAAVAVLSHLVDGLCARHGACVPVNEIYALITNHLRSTS